MTAAGVQNLDSSAYVPPPASVSTSNAKASGAKGSGISADSQAAGASDQPSDFQNELAQQTDSEGPASPGGQTATSQTAPRTSAKDNSGKTGKPDSGKPDKKRDARTDDTNPAVPLPVQAADPQKQILPFSLVLAQPQEKVPVDQDGKSTVTDEDASVASQQPADAVSPRLSAVPMLPELQQPVTLKQSVKSRQSTPAVDPTAKQNVASDAAPQTATDPGQAQALPLASDPATNMNVPVRPEGRRSEDSSSHETGRSPRNLPESLSGFKLPASPAEPTASGVQDTTDSKSASPSAMAFAARITSAQQGAESTVQEKSDQPAAVAPSQSTAIAGSQASDRIPMKHAATAQIIQRATSLKVQGKEPGGQAGPNQDDLGKHASPAIEKFAGPDTRTNMILPRFEASSEPAATPGSQAPQQAAPTAHTESVIEPLATPPATPHDIRVRVPDNNGGSTQVRFVESGGEVKVSVRTSDDGLAQNLRTHLNELSQRLSDQGMPAEIWRPVSNSSSSQNDQQPSHQDGQGSGGQGSGGHGSGGQGGQQNRQQQRPAWVEEMEASLHGE